MLLPSLANNSAELQQVLQLQNENLAQNIDDETEIKSQGFVTLRHDLTILEQMHHLAPSVIIKDDDKVVAYALTMLKQCRQLIPDLEPMFALLDKLSWNGKRLNDYSFYVMGQVCIAKQYRGHGWRGGFFTGLPCFRARLALGELYGAAGWACRPGFWPGVASRRLSGCEVPSARAPLQRAFVRSD